MRAIRPIAAALAALALLALAPAAAPADEWVQSFDAGRGGRLLIALEFGSVDVVRHDGDQVHLVAVARGVGASGVHFRAGAEGRDVTLRADAEPWVRWLRSAPGVRVRAVVPRDTRVEFARPRRVEVVGTAVVPVSLP